MLDSGGALYWQDVLSIMLSNAFGGKDMSGVARNLFLSFPSLKALLGAEVEEIAAVEGVSERVALYIKALGRLESYCSARRFENIVNGDDFLDKLGTIFSKCESECAEFFLVNEQGEILDSKRFTSGSADRVELSAEELVAFFTANRAHGLYCAHNHVTNSCSPSLKDDEITLRIVKICSMCSLKFFDHGIVDAKGNTFSYKRSGRLDKLCK